jgi:hypothetical protein
MPANWVQTGQDNCGEINEAEDMHREGGALPAEQLQQQLGGSGSAAASQS